jgi:hypothetical protein
VLEADAELERKRALARERNRRYRERNPERARAQCKAWRENNLERHKEMIRAWNKANPERCKAASNRSYQKLYERKMVERARARSKRKGLDCTITTDDVSIPTHCPILGIELAANFGAGRGKASAASPSLDRIDNTKGYVPGNVQVISKQANAAKSDLTPEQLLLFADWIYAAFRK